MKHKIKTIYFDLDGVLCDFDKRCDELSCWKEDCHRPDWAKMSSIGSEFWSLMEPIPEGMELYNSIKKFADEHNIQVGILSAIHLECGVAGKHCWIKSHLDLPRKLVKIVRMGKIKHILAAPDILLIDDNENNVRDFISAHGNAILFDRNNHNIFNDIVDNYEFG